eukprot:2650057-Pleurochrysis_carterae.AAC.1
MLLTAACNVLLSRFPVPAHASIACLLADYRLGAQEELATGARYLPTGWATLECHTRPPRPRGVSPSPPPAQSPLSDATE